MKIYAHVLKLFVLSGVLILSAGGCGSPRSETGYIDPAAVGGAGEAPGAKVAPPAGSAATVMPSSLLSSMREGGVATQQQQPAESGGEPSSVVSSEDEKSERRGWFFGRKRSAEAEAAKGAETGGSAGEAVAAPLAAEVSESVDDQGGAEKERRGWSLFGRKKESAPEDEKQSVTVPVAAPTVQAERNAGAVRVSSSLSEETPSAAGNAEANDDTERSGFLFNLFGGRDDETDAAPSADEQAVEDALSPQEEAAIDAAMARAAADLERGTPTGAVTLRPGLLLDIKVVVAGKNQLEPAAIRVSDNNQVFLPMLGQVPVGGYTIEALREELTSRYRRFYVNPEVLVDFARDGFEEGISPWGYITVLGRVKNPGRIMIPATRDLTVSGAIQGAGGFDSSARINAIRVTRRNPETGEQQQRTVNLNEVGEDGRVRDDFVLGMDDIVFVPEARF